MAVKNYIKIADKYARDIVSKKILACDLTIRACQRFLDDIKKSKKRDFPFKLVDETANFICSRIELLPHVKGKPWAGTKIKLEPWQVFIVINVFGWLHKKTKLRRFRTVYIEVPRKNAKSTLTSTIGLCMLAIDGEPGAEVYSAATTRDQAKIVFEDAQNMARRTPGFRKKYGVEVTARAITVLENASKFMALSAEGSTLDGLNVHFGAIDELHAHKTRSVFDVIETATGSRTQPLLWLITTAGSDQSGICYEQRTYVTKILEKVFDDDTYFGIIYTIDKADDWLDPNVWEKANPNYGVSVNPDDIDRLAKKAEQLPSAQNNFLTKRLNVWVNADEAWMNIKAWEACADPNLNIEDFYGRTCFVGVDLASKKDIAVMMLLFERDGHYYAFGNYYLPENRVQTSPNSQYAGWVRSGLLTSTPGVRTDYDYIETDLIALKEKVVVKEVAFDPFQATQFSTRMERLEGFTLVEVGATVKNFSEPMKELEALVLDGLFHFNGDPVLSWMVSNVVFHMDKKDNIYPNKGANTENKIDGVIGLLMALNREIRHREERSKYEDQDMAYGGAKIPEKEKEDKDDEVYLNDDDHLNNVDDW